jgi:hypothetical protein
MGDPVRGVRECGAGGAWVTVLSWLYSSDSVRPLLDLPDCSRASEESNNFASVVGNRGRRTGICGRGCGPWHSGAGSRKREQTSRVDHISDLSDLMHAILAVGVLVMLAGERINWAKSATGFLWRTWLFLYILPWWLVAARRAEIADPDGKLGSKIENYLPTGSKQFSSCLRHENGARPN